MITIRLTMLALVVGMAGFGARAQRDSILETLAPVARAAVVADSSPDQPLANADSGSHNGGRGADGLL